MENFLKYDVPSELFIKIMDYIADSETLLLWSNILLDNVTDLYLSDDLIDYIKEKVDIKDIIRSGSIRLLEQYYNKYLPRFTSSHNEWACMYGRLDILKFMESKGCSKYTQDGLETAAFCGYIDIFKHILDGDRCYPDIDFRYVANRAALNNHLDIIVLLIDMVGEYCIEYVMEAAAVNGHRNIVEYLIKRGSFVCTQEAMDGAARSNHFDIVKLLYENGCRQWHKSIVDYAIKSDDLNIVIWFDENHIGEFTADSIAAAMNTKNPDIIKWLSENKQEQIIEYAKDLKESCNYAFESGLMDVGIFSDKQLEKFRSIFVDFVF